MREKRNKENKSLNHIYSNGLTKIKIFAIIKK